MDSEPRPAAWPGGDPHSKEPGSFLGWSAAHTPFQPLSQGWARPLPQWVLLGCRGGVSVIYLPLLPPSCPPKDSPASVLDPFFSGSFCSKLTPVSPVVSGVIICWLLKSGVELTCVCEQQVLLVDLLCALGHWTICWGTVNYIILGLALKTLLPFGQLHMEAECH